MITAQFQFCENLNDFLPIRRQKVRFPASFSESASIKDAIESLGIPHTEIGAIIVNGASVDFTYCLKSNDEVAVYPDEKLPDLEPLVRLRPLPPRPAAFICDVHLGRLGRILRILGFDTLYRIDFADSEIAVIARQEGRIVLTRDRGILKRREVTHGYCVRSDDRREQVREVLRRFNLAGMVDPFTRCADCNGNIEPLEKSAIIDRLEEKTKQYYEEFSRCRDCRKLFWKGSHYQKLKIMMEELIKINSV
jgi:uncharacterized protein with PIN domain